jgi:hypothetical protein
MAKLQDKTQKPAEKSAIEAKQPTKAATAKQAMQAAAAKAKESPLAELPSVRAKEAPYTFILNPRYELTSGAKTSRIGGRRHLWLLLLITAIMGGCVAWAGWYMDGQITDSAEQNRRAQQAVGTIIGRRFAETQRALNDRWFLRIRYVVGTEQTPYEGELEVPQQTYDGLREGDAVRVKYVPETPTRIVLPDRNIAPPDLEFPLVLASCAMVAWCAVVVWSGWISWRHWRFARRGAILAGEVISCSGQEAAGGYYVTTKYRFQNPSERVITGQRRQRRDDLRGEPLPQEGNTVLVMYISDKMYHLL